MISGVFCDEKSKSNGKELVRLNKPQNLEKRERENRMKAPTLRVKKINIT